MTDFKAKLSEMGKIPDGAAATGNPTTKEEKWNAAWQTARKTWDDNFTRRSVFEKHPDENLADFTKVNSEFSDLSLEFFNLKKQIDSHSGFNARVETLKTNMSNHKQFLFSTTPKNDDQDIRNKAV